LSEGPSLGVGFQLAAAVAGSPRRAG
jgi:hypothetical protein